MASLKSVIEFRGIHPIARESGFHCLSPVVASRSCLGMSSASTVDAAPGSGPLRSDFAGFLVLFQLLLCFQRVEQIRVGSELGAFSFFLPKGLVLVSSPTYWLRYTVSAALPPWLCASAKPRSCANWPFPRISCAPPSSNVSPPAAKPTALVPGDKSTAPSIIWPAVWFQARS